MTQQAIAPERISAPEGKIISEIKLALVRDLTCKLKKKGGRNEVPIKLKSCFGILYDLARNVEVPGKDVERVAAFDYYIKHYNNGRPFIIPAILKGQL